MNDDKIRTLVCLSREEDRAAITRCLEEEGFAIIGAVADVAEASALRRTGAPDLVIVDDLEPSHNAVELQESARLHAPLPTLVFCPDAAQRKPDISSSQGKITSFMDVALLARDDGFARAHLRGRLHSLASRSSARRRTQTLRSLEDMVGQIRSEAERAMIPERVTQLSSWPLELILIVGGTGSVALLRRIFGEIDTLPVPLLIVLDAPAHAMLAEDERFGLRPEIAFNPSVPSSMLASAKGVMLAQAKGCTRVIEGMIEVMSSEASDAHKTVASMESLGPAGLTIVLSSDDAEVATALGRVANSNGLTAVVRADECLHSKAVEAALRWEVTDMALSVREITWVLSNALSQRL